MVSSVPFTYRFTETLGSLKERFLPTILDPTDQECFARLLRNVGRWRGPLANLAMPSTTMSLLLAMVLNSERNALELETKLNARIAELEIQLNELRLKHLLLQKAPINAEINDEDDSRTEDTEGQAPEDGKTDSQPKPISPALESLCKDPDRFLFPIERDLGYYFRRFLSTKAETDDKESPRVGHWDHQVAFPVVTPMTSTSLERRKRQRKKKKDKQACRSIKEMLLAATRGT